MRVPNTGQPLYERLIVREAKLVAARMMAGYVDPPDYDSVFGLYRQARQAVERLVLMLKAAAARG